MNQADLKYLEDLSMSFRCATCKQMRRLPAYPRRDNMPVCGKCLVPEPYEPSPYDQAITIIRDLVLALDFQDQSHGKTIFAAVGRAKEYLKRMEEI